MKLRELKTMLASYKSRITHIDNCMDKFKDTIQANNIKSQ